MLLILPNLPKYMSECINLIGGLLDHVQVLRSLALGIYYRV